jgi:GDP-L-fucose synthase
VTYRKILVTGATGLLGHAVMACASEHPDAEFIGIGSRDCNLNRMDEAIAFVSRIKPDAIVHTAALAGGIQYSTTHPATLLRDNVLQNLSVLEAARAAGVRKTILTLSTGMYAADAPVPIREEYIHDGPPHESNYSYAFAKRLIEPSIRAYRSEYGLSVIGLVSNGIFGEHANFRPAEAMMVASLIRRFVEQRDGTGPVVIWGDGSPLREYTYGADMARAFLWCLEHYDDPQVLHVGSTEEHSVRDTAYLIAELVGIDPARLVFDASKPSGILRKGTDNSRFVTLSAFTYTPFRVGLERTIKWFLENRDVHGRVRL